MTSYSKRRRAPDPKPLADSAQVTIRGVSPALNQRLRQVSEARQKSINATVLELLESALGISDRRERLRRYTTWNEADRREFEESLAAQRTIDEDLWR